MNTEFLEHQLCQLNGTEIILVCPQFGTVSHSFVGEFSFSTNNESVVFHFQSSNMSSIFLVDDVEKIETSNLPNINKIVRLKSPHQYTEKYNPCNTF